MSTLPELKSYLVFDFETTGLNRTSDRIIQVGLCIVENDVVARTDSWLVCQNVRIDPEAYSRHRISADDLRARGIDPGRSLEKLLAELGRAPACIGHNIHRFDLEFLAAECRRLGRAMPKSDEYVDTAALYKGIKLRRPLRPGQSHRAYAVDVLETRVKGLQYSIPACLKDLRLTLPTGGALHDACTDCVATHLVFQALRGRV